MTTGVSQTSPFEWTCSDSTFELIVSSHTKIMQHPFWKQCPPCERLLTTKYSVKKMYWERNLKLNLNGFMSLGSSLCQRDGKTAFWRKSDHWERSNYRFLIRKLRYQRLRDLKTIQVLERFESIDLKSWITWRESESLAIASLCSLSCSSGYSGHETVDIDEEGL